MTGLGPRRVGLSVLAACLVAVSTAGCGRSGVPSSRHAAALLRCPAGYPVPSGSAGPALVPTGASSVLDCGYDYPIAVKSPTPAKIITPGPNAGPTVTGPAVAGYALLLDRAHTVAPGGCLAASSGSPQDALLFGYPDGRRLVLDWRASCQQLTGPAGRQVQLSQLTTGYLISLLAEANSPTGADRVPDVVGLSLDTAVRQGSVAGLQVTDDAELTDTAPLGTVLAQGLAAGARVNGGGFGLLVSVPSSEPACTISQLGGAYTPGGPGAGTAFANISLRDASAAPCALYGTLQVTAVGSAGQALTTPQRAVVQGPLVLTPKAVDGWPLPATELAAAIGLSSTDYAGNCSGPVGHPTAWQVTFPGGGQLTVPVHSAQPINFPPILVCGHQVGVGPASLA
ncbi:MAG TPA: PASTA domain-containing protein [Mycobacteriales bacterium]|nr:PASTA domain-containing protein [Mycobacteriales bacterium]